MLNDNDNDTCSQSLNKASTYRQVEQRQCSQDLQEYVDLHRDMCNKGEVLHVHM